MKSKKLISILLSLLMILACVSAGSLSAFAAVWNGGMSPPALDNGVYVIDTAEKLAWFANQVNGGSNNITGRLTADIQLNAPASTTNQWTPIGTLATPFLGKFYGGGYVVSGLYINTSADYQGLFGHIGTTLVSSTEQGNVYAPSEINAVVIEGANITGGANVGGVVGYSNGGSVTGCSFSGAVTGTGGNTGGIVGQNRVGASVLNCHNLGTVTGTIRVGGIVGYSYSNASVQGCCAEGVINGQSYVGGLVGLSSGSYLSHSYNKSTVTASVDQAGGLVGYASYGDITRNYTLGTVNCPGLLKGVAFGNVFYGTNISRCYYNRDTAQSFGDQFATPAESALMLDPLFIETLNVGFSIFVTDYFLINGGYPILRWQLTAWDGSIAQPEVNGQGTYLISNGSELAWFAGLVNGTLPGVPRNSAANAQLTRDILLNLDVFDDSSNTWTPIGSQTYPYTGKFNGSSLRISGVYINHGTALVNYVGLFGYLGAAGSVSNLYVAASKIVAYQHVGVIVGYNEGTVTSCHNTGSVTSTYYAGGIVGSNYGTVKGCANAGMVSCANYGGGIVGQNRGPIESCFNTGEINHIGFSNGQYLGGITGSNLSSVAQCYNMGKVAGWRYIGGVIGSQPAGGSLLCVYNAGHVSGTGTLINAVIGQVGSVNSTLTYCYYNSQTSNVGDSAASAKNTDLMTMGSLLEFSGFSSTYWIIRPADAYFKYYPELNEFYYSTDSNVQQLSKKSVTVLKPEYVVMDEIDGEMNTYYTNVADASNHIGTGIGSIVLLGNCAVPSPVNIAGVVTLKTSGTNKLTLKRSGISFLTEMFQVSGIFNIDSGGTDGSPTLSIDGGRLDNLSGQSIIRIGVTGTVNLYPGTVIENNNSPGQGGGIYNNAGVLNIYGGSLSNNAAQSGGGVYNYGIGKLYAEGGSIIGNSAALNGGGIYFEGAFADVSIHDLTISGNSADVGYGGGIYNQNSVVNLSGGTVENNSAYYSGGGVYNTGTFDMSGGTISGNTAPSGSAVYENGTFRMSGGAYIAGNNVIFLKNGKTIVNTGALTKGGIVAHIYAENYVAGVRVLSGDFAAANYAKFIADPRGGVELNINSSGYLVAFEVKNVAILSMHGLYDVNYTSVKEAVEAVGAGQVGLVTVIGDDLIREKITVAGEVVIVGDGEEPRTLLRYLTFEGDMFEILEGAALEFGFSGTEDNETLIVDGSYTLNGMDGGSIVNNTNGGMLIVNDGMTLGNNYTKGNGGFAASTGEVVVTGGLIKNNVANKGGALYIADGRLYIEGGLLTGNEAVSGGAVYTVPTSFMLVIPETETDPETSVEVAGFLMSGGEISGNTATQNGGGVYVQPGGALQIGGGDISGNTAKNGKGVYMAGALVMDADSLINTDNDVYLVGSSTIELTAAFTPGTSPILLLTPDQYTVGRLVLTGVGVADMNERILVSSARFFVTDAGLLDTNGLVLKEGSVMTMDSTDNILFGYFSGLILDEFANFTDYLYVLDKDGAIIADPSSLLLFGEPSSEGAVLSEIKRFGTGCRIALSQDGGVTILDEVTYSLIGDVNCDGKIDGQDAVLVTYIIDLGLNKSQIGAAAWRAADANNDGTINWGDYDLLEKSGLKTAKVTQPGDPG